jgi:pyruvate/2-oxoglutarate dehydrogenase complex dihydrolipoamide dehydrogenase (E3) component
MVTGLSAKIGADARGVSATIVVSGTFDGECLNESCRRSTDVVKALGLAVRSPRYAALAQWIT